MTAREMTPRIGTKVYVEPFPGLHVECIVIDAKNSYGRDRFQIQAIAGSGKAWVEAARLSPAPNTEGGR